MVITISNDQHFLYWYSEVGTNLLKHEEDKIDISESGTITVY